MPQRAAALLVLALATADGPPALEAQTGSGLERERAAYGQWLATAPLSPYAALAIQPIGTGISVGPPEADLPLEGVANGLLREQGGRLLLSLREGMRPLPRSTPVRIGPTVSLMAAGRPGRMVVAAFGPIRGYAPPRWYPPDPALDLEVALDPPERRGRFLVLGLDGIETEAVEAGFVTVPVGGTVSRLRVYRLAGERAEEGELHLFFRDATNGRGTYPAGRFVELLPSPGGRYRLDLNRARNPFCAYNPVYPCPAPWPGNTIKTSVDGGEQYHPADGKP